MKEYINKNYKFDFLTLLGILSLIIVIGGIFGFIYEFIFYYLNSGMKYFYYRGGNFLPWINIYAIGSVFIFFLSFKHRKSILKVFLINILICTILEFISGYVMFNFFHYRCWDYNTEILNFGNIGGFICLRSIMFFGISSLVLIYFIVPICIYLSEKLDKRVFLIISFTLCFIFLFDEVYNLLIARILDLKRASDIYKSIGFKYMSFK